MDVNETSPRTADPELDITRINLDGAERRDFPVLDQRTEGFQVVLRQSVINDIRNHGQSNASIEICGVLVGKLCRDDKGAYLYIEGSIRGRFADGKIAQVTFTADTWDHIHRELDTRFPHLRIAGWYHTHPDFGIFLSNMDKFIHGNFFAVPWQIAYVYDPIRGKDGTFLWKNGEPTELPFLIEPDADPVEAKFRDVSVNLKSIPAKQTSATESDVSEAADLNSLEYRVTALERNQFWNTALVILIIILQLGLVAWLYHVNSHMIKSHDVSSQTAGPLKVATPKKMVPQKEALHAK